MGQSTDAYLFYGYCWTEHTEDLGFDTDMDAVVKAVLAERGHKDPWDEHYVGDEPYENYKAWEATPEGSAEVDAYRALEKQVEQELGVDWNSHCSGDYPMPLLHIRGAFTRACRGDREPIDPAALAVEPGWKGKLDAFLSSRQIEPPEGENQPGWWLVSYWG